jgi:probable rRNA maturation factor
MDTRSLRSVTEDLLISLGLQNRDLSILFVDNKKIKSLNIEFFGRDKSTNVISFSYMNGLSCEIFGDIIISLEKAREEAKDLAVPFYERVFALIIHGLLHILGFDHEKNRKESRKMRYRETKLMDYVRSHDMYKKLLYKNMGQ